MQNKAEISEYLERKQVFSSFPRHITFQKVLIRINNWSIDKEDNFVYIRSLYFLNIHATEIIKESI